MRNLSPSCGFPGKRHPWFQQIYILRDIREGPLAPGKQKPTSELQTQSGTWLDHRSQDPEVWVLRWTSSMGSGLISLHPCQLGPPPCLTSLKLITKNAAFPAHICAFGRWRKSYCWKISQTSETKHCQQMCPHLLPDCHPFPVRPCGIPWTFLLFQRLSTKAQTRPPCHWIMKRFIALLDHFSKRKQYICQPWQVLPSCSDRHTSPLKNSFLPFLFGLTSARLWQRRTRASSSADQETPAFMVSPLSLRVCVLMHATDKYLWQDFHSTT